MTEPQQTNQTQDPVSSTNVYKVVPMGRGVVSIRVRPEVKEALKRYCLANGLSLCHVFEGLVIGFLQGVNEQIEFVNKSPTMSVTVVRDVKRVRRYAVEEEVVTESRVQLCHYCKKGGVKKESIDLFTYVKTGVDYPLCEAHAEELLQSESWRVKL